MPAFERIFGSRNLIKPVECMNGDQDNHRKNEWSNLAILLRKRLLEALQGSVVLQAKADHFKRLR